MARCASVAGLLVILGLYAYFSFRPDSSFANYTPLPWIIWRSANAVDYRNFWAFGLLGIYAASVLGVGWAPWRDGRIRWGTLGLLLVPVLKESLQHFVHGRHGTPFGAAQGFAGVWCGLLLVGFVRSAWTGSRRAPAEPGRLDPR